MKKHPNRKLAEKIAKRLFTDGNNLMAGRFVFERPDGYISGAGWGIGPMTDAIEDILDAEHKPEK